MDTEPIRENLEELKALESACRFSVDTCDAGLNLENNSRYKKLDTGSRNTAGITMLTQAVTWAALAGSMANSYVVRFPEGLPQTLDKLRQGGFGSGIHGEAGRYVGAASFYRNTLSAALTGAFSIMAVATAQHFMTEISDRMRLMNMKLDEILGFLYGDKRAELIASMSFVKSCYQNYGAIMMHDEQRTAAIANLQAVRITAIKNIEFYIADLDSAVTGRPKDYAELDERVEKAFRIRESLELSEQLYVMSSLMEIFYSQNHEKEYISSVESEISSYIDKCGRRVLGSFSTLKGMLDGYKGKIAEKVDKSVNETRISDLIVSLNSGEEPEILSSARETLKNISGPAEYYVAPEGDMYLKAV